VVKYFGHVRPDLISCPTCGRCKAIDEFYEIAHKVEEAISLMNTPARVAVMGCAVNGPGEARDADIGVACGKGNAVLFQKGQKIKSIPVDRIVDEIVDWLPHIIVKSGSQVIRWRCWADMASGCAHSDPLKPCHNPKVREDYVQSCPYRTEKEVCAL
jgi:hypothetical protein